LYRRGFFDVCGFFDPDFFAYLEDVDIGLRGRLLGFHYLLVPQSLVYHQSHGSAINHAFYIQLVTQNRLLLFIKNIPTSRWIKFLPKIIYGQFYFLLAYGHLFASIRGYMGVIRKLPSVWSKRKDIKQAKVIEDWELDQLLKSEKPREGIRHHLRKLLKRFFH
ncbi:MAG: glycosyltransferase family 2 protein, partial [Saprospiraceae bacterium]|nr:glycosyltransferase family 2 protein [Saprospiraceae bacterium]